MPTKREREYYAMGFRDGFTQSTETGSSYMMRPLDPPTLASERFPPRKTKRKLSAWNKFVKANAKKPRFRLRSGAPNLKKLGVAFRKTPAGRKKKRR